MRTSVHHQPEAQHPNFPPSTSRQADYLIFTPESGHLSARLNDNRQSRSTALTQAAPIGPVFAGRRRLPPAPGRLLTARDWQRRTNVWRGVTNPARAAGRLRSVRAVYRDR